MFALLFSIYRWVFACFLSYVLDRLNLPELGKEHCRASSLEGGEARELYFYTVCFLPNFWNLADSMQADFISFQCWRTLYIH